MHIAEGDATFVREPLSAETRRWIHRALLPRPLPEGFRFERWATSVAGTIVAIGDGHTFDLGGRTLAAIATPGHSPGSLCFLDRKERLLLTGDSVLAGAIWLHLEESTPLGEYLGSLQRLRALAGEFDRMLPAHGALPLPPRMLDDLIAGVEAILAGRLVGSEERNFAGSGLRCDLGSCGILYRPGHF